MQRFLWKDRARHLPYIGDETTPPFGHPSKGGEFGQFRGMRASIPLLGGVAQRAGVVPTESWSWLKIVVD